LNPYLLLLSAIVCEVVATCALKASAGFTRWLPALLVILGYAGSFYLLSLSIQKIPIGIVYAVWSGLGTIITVIIGFLLWKETLNVQQIVGIVMILTGTIMLNLLQSPASS
jgi:multidrug transporter EmrE-like cation transporter